MTPPGWVFAVVWPTLYALFGAALVVAQRSAPPVDALPSAVCLLLGLNAWWAAFGGAESATRLSLLAIAVLTVTSAGLVARFFTFSTAAAALLAPLVAWMTFATYLTYARFNGP